MSRIDELKKIFEKVDENTRQLLQPLFDEIDFMEGRLKELKKLPFIRIHPDFPDIQKPTVAAKQYKETVQAYNNAINILKSALAKDTIDDEDEFDKYVKSKNQ